jgi:hypothetical protein
MELPLSLSLSLSLLTLEDDLRAIQTVSAQIGSVFAQKPSSA